MQKTLYIQVQSLSWEDPLEEEMATHSENLTWKIPWIEEPARLQSIGLQRVGHNWSNLATMFWFNESQKISPVPLSPAPCPFNSSDLARVTHTFLFLSLISVHMPGTSSSFSAPTCFWNSNYCLYFTSGCQSVHHITSEEVRKNKLTTCSENGIPGKSLC